MRILDVIDGGTRECLLAVVDTSILGLRHARAKLASWANDYNTELPHSELDYLAPAAQAALLTATAGNPQAAVPDQ